MTPNWGECYFDHYERFLGRPAGREVFSQREGLPRIQVLAYDGVFPDCRVFVSLGLTHYPDVVQEVAEVMVPVDEGWDQAPTLLANALFYMVQQRMALGPGTVLSGLADIAPSFVDSFQKPALYITHPFGLPAAFDEVLCHGRRGRVYLGFFISQAEREYFRTHGSRALEAALEKADMDPYTLRRPSAV